MDVILVGLPGSGKSAVGRRLAHRHGATFVDLDDVALQRLRVAVEVLEELLDRAGSTTTPHARKDG